MTWFIFRSNGLKAIDKFEAPEESTLDELMLKARRIRPETEITIRDTSRVVKAKVKQKVSPFDDQFFKGSTWISGLFTYSNKGTQHSGYSGARS